MKRATIPIQKFKDAPIQIIDGDRGENYPIDSEFLDEGCCLFLNTGNVTKSGFNFNNCQFISFDKDQILRKGKLKRNDLVMTTRGTVGNVGYYNNKVTFEDIRINSGMVIFRVDQKEIIPSFLYQYLRSTYFNRQVNALRTGAAQPQLPIRDIKCIKIQIPQIAEQEKIADILSAYDDLIDINRRRIQLLEETARLLYRERFVYFRFPGHQNVKIVDGMPEGWESQPIATIADCVGGGTPSTSVTAYWVDGHITWVTPTDVTRNKHFVLLDSEKKITEAGLQNSSAKLVPAHTVLMTSRASVGFFAIANREVCTNQGFISIVPHDAVFSLFLLFQLSGRVDEIRAMGSGSTYPEVSRGKFRDFKIIIPHRKLVSDFDEQVSLCFKQIRNLKLQNQKLAQARDLLLPRLMSGAIEA